MKDIGGGIIVVENYISQNLCDIIVQNIDPITVQHPDGLEGMYAGPSFPEEYNILEQEYNLGTEILHIINMSIQNTVSKYYNSIYKTRSLFYSKMCKGSFNRLHYDNYYLSAIDRQIKARAGYEKDKSALLYLSNDYSGGELSFPLQNVELQPKAGTLIFFEGDDTVPHEVKKVLSGERHNIICFMSSENSVRLEDEEEIPLTNDIIYGRN